MFKLNNSIDITFVIIFISSLQIFDDLNSLIKVFTESLTIFRHYIKKYVLLERNQCKHLYYRSE